MALVLYQNFCEIQNVKLIMECGPSNLQPWCWNICEIQNAKLWATFPTHSWFIISWKHLHLWVPKQCLTILRGSQTLWQETVHPRVNKYLPFKKRMNWFNPGTVIVRFQGLIPKYVLLVNPCRNGLYKFV